jgi:hypothetical protein
MPSVPHRISFRLAGASNTVMESHTAMRHVHISCYSSRQHAGRSGFVGLMTLFKGTPKGGGGSVAGLQSPQSSKTEI